MTTTEPLPAWCRTWRTLAPMLSERALSALHDALANDDPRLVQEDTTRPAPLQCVLDWPCEAACLIGYAGWQGEGLQTVGEVSDFFARMCYELDKAMDEPAGCRWLLNFFDATPRNELFPLLLREVKLAIEQRREDGTGGDPTNERKVRAG